MRERVIVLKDIYDKLDLSMLSDDEMIRVTQHTVETAIQMIRHEYIYVGCEPWLSIAYKVIHSKRRFKCGHISILLDRIYRLLQTIKIFDYSIYTPHISRLEISGVTTTVLRLRFKEEACRSEN